MRNVVDLFVICKYDRWSAYWFKELVNYILTNESSQVVAEYNSRLRLVVINRDKKLYSIRFMSKGQFERSEDGRRNYKVVEWDDGEIEKLYRKIKEATNE